MILLLPAFCFWLYELVSNMRKHRRAYGHGFRGRHMFLGTLMSFSNATSGLCKTCGKPIRPTAHFDQFGHIFQPDHVTGKKCVICKKQTKAAETNAS